MALQTAVHLPTVSLSLIFHVCQAGREMWKLLTSSDENKETEMQGSEDGYILNADNRKS